MHKLVKAKKTYKNDMFDYLNENLDMYNDYFISLKDNPFGNRLSLSYLKLNSTQSLDLIVDDKILTDMLNDSKYVCPFNGYTHHSLIPVSILTDNPIDYIRLHDKINPSEDSDPWYTSMACDPTWNKDDNINFVDQYINSINGIQLGSGYTKWFYPNDGHSSIDTIAVQLDNGDYILFLIMKWYNK